LTAPAMHAITMHPMPETSFDRPFPR